MKRMLPLLFGLLLGSLSFGADPLLDAAVLAAHRDAEERAKRLAADIQTLQENQELLLKRYDEIRQRLDKATDELRSLRDEQGRSAGNYVTRDELRKYVEKLREIDEKREADKKLILDNIKELAKVPVAPPVENKPPPRRASDSSDEAPYIYVVKKNDRLFEIIASYNDHFQKQGQGKITLEQVVKANPGLKPNRLLTGMKLRIPVPPKDNK